ncbi:MULTISPECIES: CAP domain-containing protein [unclassified Aminobacter]|uniref:CAP domain-containing protein n=1 Tax=unclassified Aminobacter TaxID=2644704 RepID=UPI0004659A76|nr:MULTISPECIES: CAP domain-containing protein [unclassified Aminobacter]
MTTLPTTFPSSSLASRRTVLIGFGATALLAAAGCTTTTQPTGSSAGASSEGAAYLRRIREQAGLSPLSPDGQLERAALEQSAYMAQTGKMAHTTSFGRDFASRMQKNGVRGMSAENVAAGRFGMDRLFEMWMASTRHRNNMLNPNFRRFGLAYTADASGERRYWALVLGV